jgi:hypothetical protein
VQIVRARLCRQPKFGDWGTATDLLRRDLAQILRAPSERKLSAATQPYSD